MTSIVSTIVSVITTTYASPSTYKDPLGGYTIIGTVFSQTVEEYLLKNGETTTFSWGAFIPPDSQRPTTDPVIPSTSSKGTPSPSDTPDPTTSTSSSETTDAGSNSPATETASGLNTGGKVAVAVCVVLAVIIASMAGYFIWRRRNRAKRIPRTPPPIPMASKPSISRITRGKKVGELDSNPIHELHEGRDSNPVHELNDGQRRAELPA